MRRVNTLGLTRIVTASALLAGAAAGFATAPAQAAEEWPTKPVTLVVGFGVGGSSDRTSRAMASFLPDELGQPVVVVNKKGAGTMLAATYVLQQPSDCYTVFASSISPFLQKTILKGGANYTLDDFAFINGQWIDYDLLFTSKESPYESFEGLFKAIKEQPKKVKMALIKGGSSELNIKLTMESLGIPYENINIVTYDGGGATRTSTAGGTTDFTIIAGDGSTGVADLIRPLAVYRKEPHPDWDAPTANSQIEKMGGKAVPVVNGSTRGFAVSAECKKEHPDRFEKIVNAFKSALAKEDVQKFLAESGIGGEFIGPEETTSLMKTEMELYQKFGEN